MPVNISELFINATVEKVWETITNPELVKQWQYGSDLISNWKPGSAIRFKTAWGDQLFEQWGKVVAFEPHRLVKYSLFAPRPGLEDRPEHYFMMSYVLTPEEGKTKLQIIQEDNRPGAKQEAIQGEENPVLKALKELAEGEV